MSATDDLLTRAPLARAHPRTEDLRPPIFDGHLHIIDPRFPLVANQGYLPPAFTIADYRASTAGFKVLGGAVVSASFQGFDQRFLAAALLELGEHFVGVTQLPPVVTDAEILELDEIGVRAVRFNLYRGGHKDLARLEEVAWRVFDLAGWHIELYIDSRDLPDLMPRLQALPRVSIDHLGLARSGLPHVLRLAEQGISIKASGFGRCDFAIPQALRAIYQVNPAALIFGTDLPSTRAARPFTGADLILIQEALGPHAARQVLSENAGALYKLA
ncbi:MAG TPA: amidohydrolase family protein [Ktedonobacteraceae bacterium]